ncbi:MAG: FAD-dependent thymidylate synthase [Patescibacteria group bacterium]|nr:FAD-dependent thymidylate synthase [Patescibacteria group bacterium]
MTDFKVNLIGWTGDPQSLSVAGALGCFEEKSSAQIREELQRLSPDKRIKKEKAVLKNSFGRGHGAVGDQNYFIFSIENLPRLATLQLCLPEYLAHLQQSLRRAKASRGFHLSEGIKTSALSYKAQETLSKSFELYEKMTQAGVPGEDARFILPLCTLTNIQTGGDARELSHLWTMSQGKGVPSVVRMIVDEILAQAIKVAPYLFEDFGFNYERLAWYPSAQLYASDNEMLRQLIKHYGQDDNVVLIDSSTGVIPMDKEAVNRAVVDRNEAELANLKHIHFEFLTSMSIAALHQAIRQRTWNHSIESIYNAAKDAIFSLKERRIVPPSIKKSIFYDEYAACHDDMIMLYHELLVSGTLKSEAIGVIPHSLKIWTAVHVNGWNAIHSIGKRTCLTAQWEIRKIARKMAGAIKEEFPFLGKWAKPQCVVYGHCPEMGECEYYKNYQKKNNI